MDWILVVLISVFLVSCNSSADSEFKNYISKISRRVMHEPKKIPTLNRLEKFHYEANETANPFEIIKINQNSSRQTARIKGPLEAFPLESFIFVGLMKKHSETRALLSKTDGELSALKIGDFIGKNEGKIIAIKDNFIRLEERFFVNGKFKKKMKKLYFVATNLEQKDKL